MASERKVYEVTVTVTQVTRVVATSAAEAIEAASNGGGRQMPGLGHVVNEEADVTGLAVEDYE